MEVNHIGNIISSCREKRTSEYCVTGRNVMQKQNYKYKTKTKLKQQNSLEWVSISCLIIDIRCEILIPEDKK